MNPEHQIFLLEEKVKRREPKYDINQRNLSRLIQLIETYRHYSITGSECPEDREYRMVKNKRDRQRRPYNISISRG